MELEAYIDGGARGNPGPAAAGVALLCGGERLLEAGYFLGNQTNNVAEYMALIFALRLAIEVGARVVVVMSDSELLVRQMTGEYRVRSETLAPLHAQAQQLLLRIDRWSIKHVRREQNRRADQLVNLALDRNADVIEFDRRPGARGRPDAVDARDTGRASAAGGSCGAAGPEPSVVDVRGDARRVRVAVSVPPGKVCEAPPGGVGDLYVGDALPAGLCLHAAHALLPTLLALRGVPPGEAAGTPVMTLRCMRGGCGAVFQLSVVPSTNGRGRGARS